MSSDIPVGWRSVTVGEIATTQYGYTASASDQPIGPKFLRITDIMREHIAWDAVPYCVVDEDVQDKYLLRPDDIVVARTGSVGASARIKRTVHAVFASYLVRLQVDTRIADPGYIEYFLRSPQWWHYVSSVKTGSVQPQFNATLMSQCPLMLPPLSEQVRITEVLGALDARAQAGLELARRLEAVLITLFDSAKTDGPVIQTTLGALGRVVGGGTPKSGVAEYWEPGEILWATPTDMTALEGPVLFDTSRKISSEGLSRSSAKLVPPGAVLMTSRATIGHTALAGHEVATNQGFITVIPEGYASATVLMAIRSVMSQVHALAGGSTFPEINKTNFKAIAVELPSEGPRAEFEEAASSVVELIGVQLRLVQRLRAIRDELLPKLVSGKLCVAEAHALRANAVATR